jgi:hypothetical protein
VRTEVRLGLDDPPDAQLAPHAVREERPE